MSTNVTLNNTASISEQALSTIDVNSYFFYQNQLYRKSGVGTAIKIYQFLHAAVPASLDEVTVALEETIIVRNVPDLNVNYVTA
jgi:hypothetical protein